MGIVTRDVYKIPVVRVRVRHDQLGYEIELDVPRRAIHRPAVRKSLAGCYYEPFSHLSFKKILDYRKNGAAIHAGTFFGDMLHTYSRSAKTLYAFEPVLENFFLAKKNAERLGLSNVILVNGALSDRNGLTEIATHDADGKFLGGASGFWDKHDGRSELVPTFRIDDLPIEDLCLIQLDVEGHENNVLNGGMATIERFEPVILVEDNLENCTDLLTGAGYGHCFTRGGLAYWARPADRDFVISLNA